MSQTPPSSVALEARANDGARLTSPSAERNKQVIAQRLAEVLPANARVLEIGSGTGQHALEAVTTRPDLLWQPSDPDPVSRASQNGWALDADGRILPSRDLNLLDANWSSALGRFDAIVSCNVIHISPWQVCQQIAARASGLLTEDGLIFLYGPFFEGEQTAPSNLAFDQSLKSRDASWGVRALDDVVAEMASGGFEIVTRTQMPANNLSLVFKRTGADHASS